MTGSSRHDFDAMPALPDMALNMIKGMVGMMMNPTNMFREMVGVMTNPLNIFTAGQRLFFGQTGAEAANRSGDKETKRET